MEKSQKGKRRKRIQQKQKGIEKQLKGISKKSFREFEKFKKSLIKRKHLKDHRNDTVGKIEGFDRQIFAVAKKLKHNLGTITGKLARYTKTAKQLALTQGKKTPMAQDQKFINKSSSFIKKMSKSLS